MASCVYKWVYLHVVCTREIIDVIVDYFFETQDKIVFPQTLIIIKGRFGHMMMLEEKKRLWLAMLEEEKNVFD